LTKRPGKKNQPSPKAISIKSVKQYKKATGSANPLLQQHLLNQTYCALWLADELTEDEKMTRFISAISMLEGIEPKDGTEGMLATQMVGTHNAAMECLRRAMLQGQSFEGRDQNLKHATKLLSICARQIEVLDKHRGKGQQKVTVEYVNVESGGQAVVGHIESGKVAGTPRKVTKPKPKAIPSNPDVPLDMEAKIGQTEPQKIPRPKK
jgi:hypothetical protein